MTRERPVGRASRSALQLGVVGVAIDETRTGINGKNSLASCKADPITTSEDRWSHRCRLCCGVRALLSCLASTTGGVGVSRWGGRETGRPATTSLKRELQQAKEEATKLCVQNSQEQPPPSPRTCLRVWHGVVGGGRPCQDTCETRDDVRHGDEQSSRST